MKLGLGFRANDLGGEVRFSNVVDRVDYSGYITAEENCSDLLSMRGPFLIIGLQKMSGPKKGGG